MSIQVTPIPRLIDLAAPAFTLGTANAAGSADTAVASDSTLLVFDTTLPAATGTAAVGTATTAPRRDHVHAGTTLAAPSLTLGTANDAGAAATAFATNSTILAFDTSDPDAITFGQSAAVGSATVTSRRDHAHAMEALTAQSSVLKAWCSITAAGALSTPDYNIATIGDTGTGDRDINFTTAFSSTVYTAVTTIGINYAGSFSLRMTTFTAGDINLLTYSTTDDTTRADIKTTQVFSGEQ
jgi:hypothetical protein